MKRFRTGGIAPWARDLEELLSYTIDLVRPIQIIQCCWYVDSEMWITYDLDEQTALKAMAENSADSSSTLCCCSSRSFWSWYETYWSKTINLFGKIATVLDTTIGALDDES